MSPSLIFDHGYTLHNFHENEEVFPTCEQCLPLGILHWHPGHNGERHA
jgi:hypothetical protein